MVTVLALWRGTRWVDSKEEELDDDSKWGEMTVLALVQMRAKRREWKWG
jgi:hypothetical protein